MSPALPRSVAVLGLGALGSALVPALRKAGLRVRTWTRGEPLARIRDAELFLLAVSDSAVAPLCARLAAESLIGPGQLVVHLAGALPLEPLAPALERGARIGSLHPLRAVSHGAPTDALRGAAAGIAGSDAQARRTLQALARALGLTPFPVGNDVRALYHAAAVLAAGAQVALFAEAVRAFRAATGVREQEARAALLPLACGALARLEELTPAQGMTGPALRGDVATVHAHRQALLVYDPRVLSLYDQLTLAAVHLAKGHTEPGALREVERLSRRSPASLAPPGPGSQSSRSPPRLQRAARPEASSRSPARRGRPTSPPLPGPAPRRPR